MKRLDRKRPAAPASPQPQLDAFRLQHLRPVRRRIATASGAADVVVDDAESPLMWLARRPGRNGRPLIEPHQLQAGERLRADFTLAHLMPRTTSSWDSPVRVDRSSTDMTPTDEMIAARQRVHRALDTVGPEFAGLLVDVCCFLKRLEDVERDRVWPARSAKVVLQLGLSQLARHYGYGKAARGKAKPGLRVWLTDDGTPDAGN
jgi:hypothetical protein